MKEKAKYKLTNLATSMTQELSFLFERNLNLLQKEIEAFQHPDKIWMVKGDVKNSAGNLCLHLVGNLKTYIGKNMGNHPYERNRDAEFSSKGTPTNVLLEHIAETKQVVIQTLNKLTAEDLDKIHPEDVLGYKMTNRFFLIHLAAHLSYHLGQINYLRRMIEGRELQLHREPQG